MHTLPEFQGYNLWFHGIKESIRGLEQSTKPYFFEGFSQNLRLLRLITLLAHDFIYPADKTTLLTEVLTQYHQQLLDINLSGFNTSIEVKNNCIVKGLPAPTHQHRKSTSNREFDSFFYETLGLVPEAGEMVFFVGVIPESFRL